MFEQLPSAFQHEGHLSRRLFLTYAASLSTIPLLGQNSSAPKKVSFSSNPFSMGVASGDPDHKSVILWTRLGPKPLEPGAGMPDHPVEVRWEVATDDSFKKIVTSGKTTATVSLGFSVHIEAKGLKPDHWYYYRFQSGDATSATGRTRTMPTPDANPGCQPRKTSLCRHLLPTLGARSLHCLPANEARPARPCLSSRRLHLRIRRWQRRQCPPPPWPRNRNSRAIPTALQPISNRPRSSSHARELPLVPHLG